MPIDPRCVLLLAGLALAGCQAPTAKLGEADIPAGRTLVTDGIDGRGEVVFAIADAAAECRAPQAWRRAGADWREAATGAPLAATPCPTVTARVAADGRTMARLPRLGKEILVKGTPANPKLRLSSQDIALLCEEAQLAIAPGMTLLEAALAAMGRVARDDEDVTA